jgi:MFS family permease
MSQPPEGGNWARNVTILAGSMLTVMAGATIAPALPAMKQAFAGTPHLDMLVRLAFTTPALFIILSAPLSGYLLDRVGRKPVLIAAVALYAVAGASSLVVDDIWSVLAGRAALGLAVGAITAGFTTMIGDLFTGSALNRFMGLQGALIHFGGVIFQVGGGFLADVSWRHPFYIYLLALPVLPGIIRTLPETKPARRAKPSGSGEKDPAADEAPMPWARLMFIYVTAFMGMTLFYMVPVQIPFHLESLLGSGGSEAGLSMAVMSLSATFAALFYGRLRAALSFQLIFALLFGCMALGYWGLYLSESYWQVLLSLAVYGQGLGIMLPNQSTWVTNTAPAARRGRAMSGLATSFYLGQFLCPLLSQPVAERVGSAGMYGVGAAILVVLSAGFTVYGLRLARAGR